MNTGDMRYIAMTPTGKWVTYSSQTSSNIGGYYCMYDDSSSLNVTGGVTLEPNGCLPKLCTHNEPAACMLDVRCHYDNATGSCGISKCNNKNSIDTCGAVFGCYYDATSHACTEANPAPVDVCSTLPVADCLKNPNCLARNGSCTIGCGVYPNEESCTNDPNCVLEDGECVKGLCGSPNKEICLQNPLCVYGANGCSPNDCLTKNSQSECDADNTCEYLSGSAPPCQVKQCMYTIELMCITDAACAWDGQKCTRNSCGLKTQSECAVATGVCTWNGNTSQCVRAQCAFTDQSSCEKYKDPSTKIAMCQWTVQSGSTVCIPRDLTSIGKDMAAAIDPVDATCSVTTKSYTGVAVALVIAVILLVGFLGFLIYRQRKVQQASSMGFGAYTGGGEDEMSPGYTAPGLN